MYRFLVFPRREVEATMGNRTPLNQGNYYPRIKQHPPSKPLPVRVTHAKPSISALACPTCRPGTRNLWLLVSQSSVKKPSLASSLPAIDRRPWSCYVPIRVWNHLQIRTVLTILWGIVSISPLIHDLWRILTIESKIFDLAATTSALAFTYGV